MKPITIGKLRALQRSSTPSGLFAILAIDHQDALRVVMQPDNPMNIPVQDLIDFKIDAITTMSEAISGVLLDPIYGAAQAIANGLAGNIGLLLEVEQAGYQMEPLPLQVDILPDWGVAKLKRMGADGAKLFYYYNAADAQTAQAQDKVLAKLVKDCKTHDVPFYAEPIFYPHEGTTRREMVIAAAKRTEALGADILKMEFPVDANAEPDESVWANACAELTAAVSVPWVLLSAGVSFDVFVRQLEIACQQGASGYIVGRAVWGDGSKLPTREKRRKWMQSEGLRRMQTLSEILQKHGHPWTNYYAPPKISTDWYKTYGE